ncbi:MAG TPA: NAD(P)-dependent oxidoreductase [Bryobacteraceae bacterium]|jgi:3-hydroxyisobutyrate dehydrogenase-like beta-hydroxyacid dehydrogenase
MKIGFIGLGRMGSGMAHNLLRAGHALVVYNRSRAKAEPLAGEGARVAASPAEASRDADAVFTMLSDDRAVEEVVFGKDGIAAALPGVHISSSTISTALARRLTATHGPKHNISAPVFGRPDAAEAKKLIVVAAGDAEQLERCRPLFDAIGRATFVAGAEPWQANAVKLCGNFMIASMIETFGEAYATLRKSGVDPHLFLETMNALFGSPVYANYGKIIADRKFEPAGFALKLGLKDVRLALETAFECSAPMPFASVLRDRLLTAMAQGQAEMDWSSVTDVAAGEAGLSVPRTGTP